MILTPEQIIHLAKQIPNARIDILKYAGDAVVRKYRELPFNQLQSDLQLNDPEIVIAAGIGTLTCTGNGYKFDSLAKQKSSTLVPVDKEISDRRYSICLACEKHNKNTDKCGTCGCGTEMVVQSKSMVFKCPEGKWDL